MGDAAVWITTVATVAAAVATAMTAWLLWRDRRDRAEVDLPILFAQGRSAGIPPSLRISAMNPSPERWMLKSIHVGAQGFEIAAVTYSGRTNEYGEPIMVIGPRGRSADVDVMINPGAVSPQGQLSVLQIAIYGSDEWPETLDLSAHALSMPRRRRSSRHTAIINITD